MISEFFERTRRLAEDHAAAFPRTAEFVAAVEDARKVIDATPPVFSFTFYLNPNPQAMGGDPAVVFPRLLAETEGWLGFIVHSVTYRIGQFLDDLVTGIKGRQFDEAASCADRPVRACIVQQAACVIAVVPPRDLHRVMWLTLVEAHVGHVQGRTNRGQTGGRTPDPSAGGPRISTSRGLKYTNILAINPIPDF
jgi:hypothetical protein